MKLSGVYIAPVTPIQSSGEVDLPLWNDLIDYLLEAGVHGLCVGGATSEYPHFDREERKELMRSASSRLRGRGRFLAAIGASSYTCVLELGEEAYADGAEAALVPMPHFFLYGQRDLEHFCREVGRCLPLPCLLYNLPAFTNPLELETTIRLLKSEQGIVGIKDSSGNPEAIPALAEACRDQRDRTSLLIGRDQLILEGLNHGWDGCISGLGNLCPELVVELFRSFQRKNLEKAQACHEQIQRISDELIKLPIPWAIRIGLEVRGLKCGPPALPIAPEREEQAEQFRQWYRHWLKTELRVLTGPASPDARAG